MTDELKNLEEKAQEGSKAVQETSSYRATGRKYVHHLTKIRNPHQVPLQDEQARS